MTLEVYQVAKISKFLTNILCLVLQDLKLFSTRILSENQAGIIHTFSHAGYLVLIKLDKDRKKFKHRLVNSVLKIIKKVKVLGSRGQKNSIRQGDRNYIQHEIPGTRYIF